MSTHHHPPFPHVLQKYEGLPGGRGGTLQVVARSGELLELALASDFVGLTRDDAQELVRVLGGWLAHPHDPRRHESVVVDGNPQTGAPTVVVLDPTEPHHRRP